jgi:hypothetical protein
MNILRQSAMAALTSLALTGATALAQTPAVPSLQDMLKTQYKVTTTGSDAEGLKVIEAGTVLSLNKGGVIATPQNPVGAVKFNPFQKMCSNTFKNGNLTTAKGCSITTEGSRYLTKGST